MATFHQFPELPFELRILVWRATVEPRTVDLRFEEDSYTKRRSGTWSVASNYLASSMSVPAPLHTCREARGAGLYRKAYSIEGDVVADPRESYVWVNWDLDVIAVRTDLDDFLPLRRVIQRLYLAQDNYSEHWYHNQSRHVLSQFESLREAYVLCLDKVANWSDTIQEHSWPCPKENVYLQDPSSGRAVRAVDLSRYFEHNRMLVDRDGPEAHPDLLDEHSDLKLPHDLVLLPDAIEVPQLPGHTCKSHHDRKVLFLKVGIYS
ncbi:uncharacterized protein B0I36DRAFT_332464 [Microdochium trichocladiopsis]|uniref:2EXR domain-containing protein n=1 Tax=Microdochium trichocladiopsis TaxID=1682393 RepID=A0A9P8Y0N7_9PEZI|nr:uncharacterized protein B0I36DRAFT_332464 [Microdochium trichocladiopsis]KAH7025063.1 hypothetical protein B0I36DRAFT_332464 [Microdochium trichocladiopsis]